METPRTAAPSATQVAIKDAASSYAKAAGIIALILAIVSLVIPVVGVLFFVPLAIIAGSIALYGGSKGMGIATIVVVAVNLFISPTFWLNVGAGATQASASSNRLLTWFDIIGVLFMIFLAARKR